MLGYAVLLYLKNTPLLLYIHFILITLFGFSHSLGSWSGRPEISLLLRLIDESQRDHNSKNLTDLDAPPPLPDVT
jgi:hypothetical protein